MKRILLLALMLSVSACGDDKGSPTAPASALRTDGSSTATSAATSQRAVEKGSAAASGASATLKNSELATSAVPVPFHILHPVMFPMQQGIVTFPPRNEPNTFFQNLQALYRDFLRRPQTAPTYVDSEGQNVWLTEYFRFYLNGCSHEDASSRTLTEIATGGTLPTCGTENLAFPPRNLPNDFQGRLQATYRDVLRRPQTLSYVDSEGANVWLAQYLRFRVTGGCGHADAENKVFMEIRGGGVQPDCSSGFSFQGTWAGNYRIGTCTDSGDQRSAGGCTIFRVGTILPITTALRQSGSRVDGTLALGSVTGGVGGGTVQGNRLTGLTGRLTISDNTIAIDVTGWDTTGSGNNMAGDIVAVYTDPGATGAIVLGLQLQGVTRVSTSATTDPIDVNQIAPSEAFGSFVDRLAAAVRLFGVR